jgi:S-adenosylmethionine synthetase
VLNSLEIESIARQAIRDIGYTVPGPGFDADTCEVMVRLKPQSPNLSQGVSVGEG